MRFKYYKEDDILVITLSNKLFEYAEMEEGVVVHYTEKNEPVRIEVINANEFMKKANKSLPKEVREKIAISV